MKSKKKLVEEYIQRIVGKLCYDHGVSLREAHKLVEELDLLNTYKDDYKFLLHKDISTWVDIIVDRHKKEMEKENLKNKTTVKPLSYQLLVYHEQPTTKNTKIGDMVLYKSELWLNDGNIVAPMSLNNYINIDKDGTILKKPLTKDYVDEKVKEVSKENTMENYIVINGKKAELTEEQLNYLCMFNRFAQVAKEQFGLTITQKETAGETFKTLFGIDFSDCSERKNPFNSELKDEDSYFIIDEEGVKTSFYDSITDKHRLNNINSFNDKDFAKQVYLHELLNRKLLKFAYDNNAEDCKWNEDCANPHYYIYFDNAKDHFVVEEHHYCHSQNIYFSKQEVAKQAIEDIIKPFIAEHPEFIW